MTTPPGPSSAPSAAHLARLDEMEETWHKRLVVDDDVLASEVYDEVTALIAKARAQDADRVARYESDVAGLAIEDMKAWKVRAEQAERERDVLRALLEEAFADREAVRDPDESCYWCESVPPRDHEMDPANLSHTEDCLGERIRAALAQPTDRAHTNDVAPGITLSHTEKLWGASCDWGHCDGSGAGFRWCADLSEWLPVCAKHLMAPHGDAQPTDAGGA